MLTSTSSVKDLASAGIVSFDESGFISALPEAFHMTKHLVRFHTMQNIMGMEHENASIAKVSILYTLFSHVTCNSCYKILAWRKSFINPSVEAIKKYLMS